MRIRIWFQSAPLALAALLFAGCGDQQADVKGLSAYTPEILIQETLYRYKTVAKSTGDGAAESKAAAPKGKAGAPKGKGGGDDEKEAAAAAKYGEESRSHSAPSHDDAGTSKGGTPAMVFDDVARKVKLIEGVPADQVYAKLLEAVDYDPELTSEQKDAFKAGLDEARKNVK